MVTVKEHELSVDEVSAILPEGDRFRWFVLMLKYTGLRVFMDEEQDKPDDDSYTIVNIRNENGAAVAFDHVTYWNFFSHASVDGLKECLLDLVSDLLNSQTNGVVRFSCAGRTFECPVSATELKMKLELRGVDV